MTVRALWGQEPSDDAAIRRIKEPVSLAADRVTHWRGPDGQRWVHLWGNAVILHGPDTVVRAREVIIRISDDSTEFDKLSRVDVYAEGPLRSARDSGAPRTSARASIRTGETRLKCYQPRGAAEANDPPWGLQIIARSGFRAQKNPPAQATRRDIERELSPIDSRFEALVATAERMRQQTLPKAKVVPILPTHAIVRNQSADVADSPPSLDASLSVPESAPSLRSSSGPKRDPMVKRAGTTDESAPVAAAPAETKTTRTTDPQVIPTRAQQPRTGTQPPIIDLPPIEGAPEVEVPNLTPGQDDRPPNIQPLPGVEGEVTVPELPEREPLDKDGKPLPIVPVMPGS
jgi:hypothetical protein